MLVTARKPAIGTREVSFNIGFNEPKSKRRIYKVTPRSKSHEMHNENQYFDSQSFIHPAGSSISTTIAFRGQDEEAENSIDQSFPSQETAGADRGQSSWHSNAALSIVAFTTQELSKSQQLTRAMSDMYY